MCDACAWGQLIHKYEWVYLCVSLSDRFNTYIVQLCVFVQQECGGVCVIECFYQFLSLPTYFGWCDGGLNFITCVVSLYGYAVACRYVLEREQERERLVPVHVSVQRSSINVQRKRNPSPSSSLLFLHSKEMIQKNYFLRCSQKTNNKQNGLRRWWSCQRKGGAQLRFISIRWHLLQQNFGHSRPLFVYFHSLQPTTQVESLCTTHWHIKLPVKLHQPISFSKTPISMSQMMCSVGIRTRGRKTDRLNCLDRFLKFVLASTKRSKKFTKRILCAVVTGKPGYPLLKNFQTLRECEREREREREREMRERVRWKN